MAGVTPGAGRAGGGSGWSTSAAAGLVAAGGTLGVAARALVEDAVPAAPGTWPWATWTINVAGSFLLGLLLGRLDRGAGTGRSRVVRLGVGTGVLGGFTTYSTFALETVALLDGSATLGLAYALVSVVVGVGAAVAGLVVARRGSTGGAAGGEPGRAPDGPGAPA